MRNGARNGNGYFEWNTKKNKKEGKKEFLEYYDGDWVENKREGYGVQEWKDGRKYTG